MKDNKALKDLVRQRYSELALNDLLKGGCCCGKTPAASSKKVYTIMSEDYTKLKGYEPDADLGVGCGLPTEYARIKPGDTVVDLGSGAGNDYFIARAEVGCESEVIGVDFSPQMIEKVDFKNVRVERTKTVVIPDEVLYEHLDEETIRKYKEGNVGIYSITVTGEKS